MPVIDSTYLDPNKQPLTLIPHQVDSEDMPTLQHLNEVWDIHKYAERTEPIILGQLSTIEPSIRVLDLPVKVPFNEDITLPEEVSSAQEFVQQIIDYVKSKYPARYENSYAYLTTDSGTIPHNTSQRNSGLHVDGFEGARIKEPLLTDFSFIAMDNEDAATIFYLDGFPCAHLDRAKDNFSAYWTQYAQKHQYQRIYARAYNIYGMNAYTVHEAGKNLTGEPIERSFLRLSFSVREFDRLGNTENPFLNLGWTYYPRDIQSSLNTYFPELSTDD